MCFKSREKPPGWRSEFRQEFAAAYLPTPSLGILTPTPPHSKPKLFACHFRNLRPVRGTGRLGCSQLHLFSESQQLPLTGSFSPALLPPDPRTSGGSLGGLEPLGSLSPLWVSCSPHVPMLPKATPATCFLTPSTSTTGVLPCRTGLQT